jgi:uncharacterized protein YecE (DUF72 family)
MQVLVGTSGYGYKEWKGTFYPAKIKAADMLAYYAERLATVEINNTFYRMPKRELLEKWRDDVPDGFVFVLKAPQRITHVRRLKAEAAEDVAFVVETSAALGAKRGPFLFQTPPAFRKETERLREFLSFLPEDVRAAFEFRHESWEDEEVRAALAEKGAALCVADVDEAEPPSIVATGRFGYLRLRRADYDAAALARWADRLLAQPWDEAFVFFKHEDEGRGPALAEEFRKVIDARQRRS